MYQHNQTDLEFLRARGKTIGYQIWCEDTKLIFDAPKLLGSSPGAATLGDFGQIDSFLVDHPIFSLEEVRAIAQARLAELAMSFLTADAEAPGHSRLKPGTS